MEQINDNINKARKLAKSTSWFNRDSDREKAMDIYIQAFNKLLISKAYQNAAEVAVEIAELSDILDDKTTANDYYKKAAVNFYKSDDSNKSIEIYNKLITRLEEMGHFSICAKCLEELGEIYEHNLRYQDAISTYKRSCDLYEVGDRTYATVKLLNKIAELHINQNETDKARDVYSNIVNTYGDNNLSKLTLPSYLLCYRYVNLTYIVKIMKWIN